MKPLRWKMWVFPCQTGILLKSTKIPRRFLRRELETSWGSEPDSLLFRFGVLAVVSSWLEEVVSTIHFSNKSRCFCEKCWETTSFLTSRGSSFKRSRTFLSILFSHLAAGASEVSPKDLGGDLLGAAAGFAALAWRFCLGLAFGEMSPEFFPIRRPNGHIILLPWQGICQNLQSMVYQMKGLLATTFVRMYLQSSFFEGQLNVIQAGSWIN